MKTTKRFCVHIKSNNRKVTPIPTEKQKTQNKSNLPLTMTSTTTTTQSVLVNKLSWICCAMILFVSMYEIEGYSVQQSSPFSSKIQARNHHNEGCSIMNPRLTSLKPTTIAMTSTAVLSNADDVQAKDEQKDNDQVCLAKCLSQCIDGPGDSSADTCVSKCLKKCPPSIKQEN